MSQGYVAQAMYNTGARVSEVVGLRDDLDIGPVISVSINGKGKKQRRVPFWKTTTALLTKWLKEIAAGETTPLFPGRHGLHLSRSGVEVRLQRAVSAATARCSSLQARTVSPHTLRHTTAMHLLQSGVDVMVIALWLGHESPETTKQYVEADLEIKQRVLDRIDEPALQNDRRRKTDELLDFLDNLQSKHAEQRTSRRRYLLKVPPATPHNAGYAKLGTTGRTGCSSRRKPAADGPRCC